MEALIKGNQIKLAKQFLTEKYGLSVIDKVVSKMETGDGAIIFRPTLDMSWEPLKPFVLFLATADKVFGKGDYEVCRQIGIYQAKESVSKFYQIFIKMGNPFFCNKKSEYICQTAPYYGTFRN